METDVYRLISHPLQDPSTLRGGLAIHKKIAEKCRRPFSDPPGDLIDRWEHRDGRGRAPWANGTERYSIFGHTSRSPAGERGYLRLFLDQRLCVRATTSPLTCLPCIRLVEDSQVARCQLKCDGSRAFIGGSTTIDIFVAQEEIEMMMSAARHLLFEETPALASQRPAPTPRHRRTEHDGSRTPLPPAGKHASRDFC